MTSALEISSKEVSIPVFEAVSRGGYSLVYQGMYRGEAVSDMFCYNRLPEPFRRLRYVWYGVPPCPPGGRSL
jgi:hypothetical protein